MCAPALRSTLRNAFTAYASVPGATTSTASSPTGTAGPAARTVCGRGHTAGGPPSLSWSRDAGAGRSGAGGAAAAPGAPPSRPPITASATAVAPLLRPNCTPVLLCAHVPRAAAADGRGASPSPPVRARAGVRH
ncbi:hypothetical protein GCM10018987_35130 [Streptomyces cremeus]